MNACPLACISCQDSQALVPVRKATSTVAVKTEKPSKRRKVDRVCPLCEKTSEEKTCQRHFFPDYTIIHFDSTLSIYIKRKYVFSDIYTYLNLDYRRRLVVFTEQQDTVIRNNPFQKCFNTGSIYFLNWDLDDVFINLRLEQIRSEC